MTRGQIKEMLAEKDFLLTGEMEALADMIFYAIEEKPGAREKAAAVIEWLYIADRIYLNDRNDLLDLIF